MRAPPAMAPDVALRLEALSVQEMEDMLFKPHTKPRAPVSARAVLEENRIEAERVRAEKQRQKRSGRQETAELLREDQQAFGRHQEAQSKRKDMAVALAEHYREEIAARAARRKAAKAPVEEKRYFPFTDGERVEQQQREAKARRQAEMQACMEELSPRPRRNPQARPPVAPYVGEAAAKPPQVHSFNDCYPKFLSKAEDHMTRRTDVQHVHRAMRAKMDETYSRLQGEFEQSKQQERQRNAGLALHDRLTGVGAADMLQERRKNAEVLRQQMEDKRQRLSDEKAAYRAHEHGYYGPPNKQKTDVLVVEHKRMLKAQMQEQKSRLEDDREFDLKQDRILNANMLREMVSDHERSAKKVWKYRETLKRSWEQQLKMKGVRDIVAAH